MRAVVAHGLFLVLSACADGKPSDILSSSDRSDSGVTNSAPTVAISSHSSGDIVDAAEALTLEATVEDSEDSAAALSLSWSSNVDGELGQGTASTDGAASLSTGGLSLGTHTLTLIATDTDGAGGSDSVNIIVNDAPVVSHIAITPETALSSDELTCIWTLSDAFGVISATGEWQVNGGSAGTGESGMTLAGAFGSGDDVSCTVRPMDEYTAGLPVTTRVTIAGLAPVVLSVTLSPSEVRTNDTLTAEVSTSDEDGDDVSVSYAWFVDGVEVDGEAGPTLDGALHFDRDQSVHVVATPADGVLEGEPMSSEAIVVDNTPPTAPEIAIETSSDGGVESSMTGGSSAMISHETYTCVVTGESEDADGDEVSYDYDWTLGGVDYPDSTATYAPGDTISSGGGEPGSTWACSVTPHDGTDPGASADVSYASPCGDGDGDGVFGLGCGGLDCDDMEASIHPGADEICDGLDNDCDGVIDPDTSVDVSTWYCDRDDDGYGIDDGSYTPITTCYEPDPAVGWAECSGPDWATNSADCNDSSASINPGEDEVCDDQDNDCDGVVDTDAIDRTTWYEDRDRDGFGGDYSTTYHACTPGWDWDSVVDTDCNDYDSDVYPDADETCNEVDDDCDGEIDEGGVTATWWLDADGDGYGDAEVALEACPTPPSGYVRGGSLYSRDCNDADPEIHPYADETCDGEDEDCNGVVDDDAVDADRYYVDADGDGYGSPWGWVASCETVSDRVRYGNDCDDEDPYISPAKSDTPLWERDCDYGTSTHWLSSSDHTFKDEEDAGAGFVVAGAGDVDGDGLADVLVGAPNASIFVGSVAADQTGGAYLILSSSMGEGPASMSLNGADYRFAGEAEGDEAGQSAASAGDLDGDGLADILIGAPLNSEGGTEAGKAYVVLSASLGSAGGRWLSDAADYSMVGESSADNLGRTVASAGDVDGDDRPDLLIAAPSQGAGAVMVMRASSLGPSSSLEPADADWLLEGEDGVDVYAGQSTASAGDVDGDGLADLIIGAPSEWLHEIPLGRAHVVLAGSLGTTETLSLASADYTFVGESVFDLAGWSVSSAGDYDDDGLDDILIGAPGYDEHCCGIADYGVVYVILGSSMATVAEGDLSDANVKIFCPETSTERCQMGFSVANAGPLYEDAPHGGLLLGAPGHPREVYDGRWVNGRAFVMRHHGTFVEDSTHYFTGYSKYMVGRSHTWEDGEYGYGVAGWSVASAGDVNGDGRSDVLVGDPEVSESYLIFSGL